jgi:hypothetical protein
MSCTLVSFFTIEKKNNKKKESSFIMILVEVVSPSTTCLYFLDLPLPVRKTEPHYMFYNGGEVAYLRDNGEGE